MGLVGPFGFGCADFGPGHGSSRYRGFVFHDLLYVTVHVL
jgi:hypothetical protein